MSRALGSKYTLGESIGRGAMGEAYRGTDHQGNELAFKLLHAELARDPELVERFVKERSILLALRGENLVEVRDLVIEGDTLAIVMDLVTGGDLRQAISRNGPFSPAEVCRIGAGIARGLEVVHATGIIHRDIKPANILLGGTAELPVPKLSDFGISSLIDDAHMRSTTVVGTPQYIAPEVAAGRSAIPASDLYALGIVLYELAVGVTPFAGGSVMAVLLRHGTSIAARPEGIPDPLWDLIASLLSKDPAARPADARTAAEALEALRVRVAGTPAAPRLASPLAPLPLTDVTPIAAVAMPATVSGPAVALAPPPPESAPEVSNPTSYLPPTPPGPGLRAAYASISDPVGPTQHADPNDHASAQGPVVPGGSLDPEDSLQTTFAAPVVRNTSLPPAGIADGLAAPYTGVPTSPVSNPVRQAPGSGSRTAMFVVLGLVAVVALAGAGILIWFLNGDRGTPSPPVASNTSPTAPLSPTGSPTTQPTDAATDPAATTAPQLKGKTEAEARALLPAGTKISIINTTSLDVLAGQVSAQDPQPGEPLQGTMSLTVESGLTPDAGTETALPTPAQGSWLSIDGVDLRGTTHDTALGVQICAADGPDSGKIVYDLDGKYSAFSATAALAKAADENGTDAHIEVHLDGKVLDSATLSEFSFREWDFDLTGAKKLEFEWTRGTCGSDSALLGLGSPVFTAAG